MLNCEIGWKRSVLLCSKCYYCSYLIREEVFEIYQEFDVHFRMYACMCVHNDSKMRLIKMYDVIY